MATDNGPGTGSAVLFLGNPPTASVEVHVGNPPSVLIGDFATGINSLPPSAAPFVDPSQAGTSISGNSVVPINKTITFGSTGATVVVANPA